MTKKTKSPAKKNLTTKKNLTAKNPETKNPSPKNKNAVMVREWLKENDWHFSEKTHDDGVVTFRMSVAAHGDVFRSYDISIICRERDVQSLFFPPVGLSAKTKAETLEYVNRVNYRFRIGKLTVDMRDGEIRWETVKTTPDLQADRDDAMDDLIGFPGFVLDKYAAGLAKVILGAATAEAAYEECDREEEEPSEGGEELPVGPVPVEDAGAVASEVSPIEELVPPASEPEAKPAEPKGLKNYSLEGLNLTTNVPLAEVVSAVKLFREGASCEDVDAPRLNILLSGAPGSGKTAFVKYLAHEVGAPLKVVKASDLLSRYSGETEKRIARVFSEAKENNEILFLDEIDSFLQDRAGASRSWEVTQVNELLQQMEEFGGVMVGATNFVENLDKAVVRRFTYKLKLDYLTEDGKSIFFERYFKTPLTDEEKTRLSAIRNLTPGDFRTVREELYYLADRQDNASRLAALEVESAAKGVQAKIGF